MEPFLSHLLCAILRLTSEPECRFVYHEIYGFFFPAFLDSWAGQAACGPVL